MFSTYEMWCWSPSQKQQKTELTECLCHAATKVKGGNIGLQAGGARGAAANPSHGNYTVFQAECL